jgi:hypothetical protein
MGKSVFLTGAAGSGKTYLLNRYIHWLRERGVEPAVTASTGIAASHLQGQTIHSWSGIGVKEYLGPYELDRIEQNEKLVKRFRATRVLIIDEISMLSGNTLSLVDTAIRTGLQSNEPFGGMQVVLCGDFFQLPPVVRSGGEGHFAFQGEAWHTLGLHLCYLTEQFRQNDDALLSLLNGIRLGEVQEEHRAALVARMGHAAPEGVPHLYTHNVDVDKQNIERLIALPGFARTYEMRTKGSKKYVELLRRGVMAPDVLQLKKDAVVMFVKNDLQGTFVNGTLGTVTDFSPMGDPIVTTRDGKRIEVEPESWRFEDGDTVRAEIIQVPLRLAWAVTVHKSQGMTLDAARIDLSKTFVAGQGYVALSRVRSLTGLYLEGMHDLAFSRHPAVAEADLIFRNASLALERRLHKTPPERLVELARAFVVRIGGSEPDPSRPRVRTGAKKVKENTLDVTHRLVSEHRTPVEIAEERGLSLGTVLTHLERLARAGRLTGDDLAYLWHGEEGADEALAEISAAFAKTGEWNLTPVFEAFDAKYAYETLRVARLLLRPWKE